MKMRNNRLLKKYPFILIDVEAAGGFMPMPGPWPKVRRKENLLHKVHAELSVDFFKLS